MATTLQAVALCFNFRSWTRYVSAMEESQCRRCGAPMGQSPWSCWLCGEGLCDDCGDRHGHCDHADPPLDEIDRLWATADDAKRAELLALIRELAAKYGDRGPALLHPPKTEKLN